jgi:hypothetical protein
LRSFTTPGWLDAKLEAHRTRVGAREVEFRSAAEQLRRELGELTASSSGCSIFTSTTQAP